MPRPPTPIHLSAEERTTLQAWQRGGSSDRRLGERAEIVLRAADGQATRAIAVALRTRPARVSKWRTRFAKHRLRGLGDQPRTGAPRAYEAIAETRVLDLVGMPPPSGHRAWTGVLLAAAAPGLSVHQTWRLLRRHGISLRRRRCRDSGHVAVHLSGRLTTSGSNRDQH